MIDDDAHKRQVRTLMERGMAAEQIAERSGLPLDTVVSLQHELWTAGEALPRRGPGRPRATDPKPVRITARMRFTPAQLMRIQETSDRYGYPKTDILIEALVATIADDDLFSAVLDHEVEL